jgi:hypothetical protein
MERTLTELTAAPKAWSSMSTAASRWIAGTRE